MSQLSFFKNKRYNDLFYTCAFVLKLSDVKYNKSTLQSLLEAHVEYPSLLSLKDVLAEYNVASLAIRKGNYTYDDIETPFVCSIQKEGWSSPCFTVVTEVDALELTYLDPFLHETTKITTKEFSKIDKDFILLIDFEEARDEVDYLKNKQLEITKNIVETSPFLLLIGLFIYVIFNNFLHGITLESGIKAIFLSTSLIGILISTLLIRHEVNSHDPFVKEVCGILGKKSNCTLVLSSKRSSFLGISWSVWGFSFFLSGFISHIFLMQSLDNLVLWSLISILVSPYLFFSLFYQWYTIKQWCPLCLAVQGLIFFNALAGIVFIKKYHFEMAMINYYNLLVILLFGLLTLALSYLAIIILKRASDSYDFEIRWKKLRYSTSIFNSLLAQSNQVTAPFHDTGIIIGNKNASTEIIKVCNPYCGPCSRAHPELDNIIKNNHDLRVRIIFTASGSDHDFTTPPVLHLLAIQEEYGDIIVDEALNEWYLSPNKDYESFSKKYPLKGDVAQQKEKIITMRNWCNDMKIRATPTFFINGRELPDGYSIKDLKYFF